MQKDLAGRSQRVELTSGSGRTNVYVVMRIYWPKETALEWIVENARAVQLTT